MTDEQIIAIADGLGFPSDDNEAITFARALLSASIADTALVSERCTRYAKELAVSLHRQHFAESAPQWKPLDDLYGLLSQIDNMSTELVRRADTAGAKPVGIPLLAEDHKGMLVDYSGMFKQARGALARGHKEPMLAEMLRQMQDHITELGKRWYAGDTAVVDELLQLYCVEKGARDALVATPPAPSVASTAKPVQVIPHGVMGIPPNPPGSASLQVRSDIISMNAAPSVADAAGASEDAQDAARWRHLRNCGVIVDFTHAGPWKFTDDVDAAVDKLMARSAAINAARGSKTTERKKLCKGSHIMCEGREYCLAYPSCSELEAKESGND